jgi:hypothetical protein
VGVRESCEGKESGKGKSKAEIWRLPTAWRGPVEQGREHRSRLETTEQDQGRQSDPQKQMREIVKTKAKDLNSWSEEAGSV